MAQASGVSMDLKMLLIKPRNWFANSYIAIDQGPIIVMIENYRSGLLWE